MSLVKAEKLQHSCMFLLMFDVSLVYAFTQRKEQRRHLVFACKRRRGLPLPGNGEERADELPAVRLGVHIHAEVHRGLEEIRRTKTFHFGTTTQKPIACREFPFSTTTTTKKKHGEL